MEIKQLKDEFGEILYSGESEVDEQNSKSCASITIQFFLEHTKHLTTFDELQNKIKEIENAKRELDSN